MAKNRKYDQETIDGILWNRHEKRMSVTQVGNEQAGTGKIVLGYAHSPVIEKPVNEDDAKAVLEQLVSDGVYTWKQIVGGLYDIVLQQFKAILDEYKAAEGGKSRFVFEKHAGAYQDVMAKYDHTQWTEMFAAVKAAWEANNVVGVDDWDPSKHTLFPKDVR